MKMSGRCKKCDNALVYYGSLLCGRCATDLDKVYMQGHLRYMLTYRDSTKTSWQIFVMNYLEIWE